MPRPELRTYIESVLLRNGLSSFKGDIEECLAANNIFSLEAFRLVKYPPEDAKEKDKDKDQDSSSDDDKPKDKHKDRDKDRDRDKRKDKGKPKPKSVGGGGDCPTIPLKDVPDEVSVPMLLLVASRDDIVPDDVPRKFPFVFNFDLKCQLEEKFIVTYVVFYEQGAIQVVNQGHFVPAPKDSGSRSQTLEIRGSDGLKIPVGFGAASTVHLHLMVWHSVDEESDFQISQLFSNQMLGRVSSYMNRVDTTQHDNMDKALSELTGGVANSLTAVSDALSTSPNPNALAASEGFRVAAGTVSFFKGVVDTLHAKNPDRLLGVAELKFFVERSTTGIQFTSAGRVDPRTRLYASGSGKHKIFRVFNRELEPGESTPATEEPPNPFEENRQIKTRIFDFNSKLMSGLKTVQFDFTTTIVGKV